MTMKTTRPQFYRPDIDGLRAVAVLAVLIFHINESYLPGGFAGVDIFFVISGFLITGIITRNVENSKFTFADFYRKRILRIIPPLVVVLIFTLIMGQLLFLPEDFIKLSWSAFASILSIANIYFYQFLDTSYFAADASVNPLLHIWSLGVEEQFYIFWPLMLILLIKLRHATAMLCTLVIAIASFVYAQSVVHSDPMFAYYMLPTRAGQLMAGAFVFMLTHWYRPRLPMFLRVALSLSGLFLMLGSLYYVSSEISFPGISAIPVTLGTALVIFIGSIGDDPIKKIIGNRVSIAIGLISYSLYLWHWPVFAFYKYFYGHFTLVSGAIATSLVFIFTLLTYFFVEKPIRHWKAPTWPVVRNIFILPSILIGLASISVISTQGYGLNKVFGDYETRFEQSQATPLRASLYPYVCQAPVLRKALMKSPRCIINSEKEPKVLLWGDSNGAHYVGMLAAFAEKEGFAFRNIAHSSCPPLIKDAGRFVIEKNKKRCSNSARLVTESLEPYEVVVLSASWPGHLRRANGGGRVALAKTVDALTDMGKSVIILGKTPILKGVDPTCMRKSLKASFINCSQSGLVSNSGTHEVNVFLESLANERQNVSYFGVDDYFCNGAACSPFLGNLYAYYDPGHLSIPGSWALGREILAKEGLPDAFSALLKTPINKTKNSNLEIYLENRSQRQFENFDQRSREILNVTNFETLWYGNADLVETSGKFIRLLDDRDDKFEYRTYDISDKISNLENPSPTSKVLVKIEFEGIADAAILVRISTTANDKSVVEKLYYDMMVNLNTTQFKLKKLLNRNDVLLEKKGNVTTLLMSVSNLRPNYKTVLSLYPASADTLGSFSETAIGDVTIKSIRLIVEPQTASTL